MMVVGQLVSQSKYHNMEKEQATSLQEIQRFCEQVVQGIANDTREATLHEKKAAPKKTKRSGKLEDTCNQSMITRKT